MSLWFSLITKTGVFSRIVPMNFLFRLNLLKPFKLLSSTFWVYIYAYSKVKVCEVVLLNENKWFPIRRPGILLLIPMKGNGDWIMIISCNQHIFRIMIDVREEGRSGGEARKGGGQRRDDENYWVVWIFLNFDFELSNTWWNFSFKDFFKKAKKMLITASRLKR